MGGQPGGKVVFLGNVPFDLTEEQVINIFKVVGPVVNFRLLWDKENNRSRGYGFCEYADAETAASAVRNLNNTDINGRTIRVDWADNDSIDINAKNFNPTKANAMSSPVSSIPANATEPIQAILQSMSPNQLYEVMMDMKFLVQSQPDNARQLLMQHPQLSYALFQALIVMGAINQNVIESVLQNAMANAGVSAPVSSTPSVAPPTYAPPPTSTIAPPPIAAPPPAAAAAPLPEHQKAALDQILQLSEAQISALPPDQQQQIRLLKSQFTGRV